MLKQASGLTKVDIQVAIGIARANCKTSKFSSEFFRKLETNIGLVDGKITNAGDALRQALGRTEKELITVPERKSAPLSAGITGALSYKGAAYLLGLGAAALELTGTLKGAALSGIAIFLLSMGAAVGCAKGALALLHRSYDKKAAEFEQLASSVQKNLDGLQELMLRQHRQY